MLLHSPSSRWGNMSIIRDERCFLNYFHCDEVLIKALIEALDFKIKAFLLVPNLQCLIDVNLVIFITNISIHFKFQAVITEVLLTWAC